MTISIPFEYSSSLRCEWNKITQLVRMWKIKIAQSLAICVTQQNKTKQKKHKKKDFYFGNRNHIHFISHLQKSIQQKYAHPLKVFYIFSLCYALLSADIDRHIYSMGNFSELDVMVVFALVFHLNVLNVRMWKLN